MKLLHLVIAAASLISLPAFAVGQLCNADSVHCTKFTMAQSSQNSSNLLIKAEGRYVKVVGRLSRETVDSFVDCFDVNSSLDFPADNVESGHINVGDVFNAEYWQCEDKRCDASVLIGFESFVIEKRSGVGYTSTPSNYMVQLKNDYGASCDASVSFARIHTY